MFEANGFEAVRCLENWVAVVVTVADCIAIAAELVVALVCLTDKTVRQDRGEFVLKCL